MAVNKSEYGSICLYILKGQTVNYGRSITNQNTNEVISFIDAWSPPAIFLLDEIYICGTLMKIMEELSKKYGYSIRRIDNHMKREDAISLFLSGNWSFILYPMSVTILKGIEEVVGNEAFTLSRAIGVNYEGKISSKIIPGQRSPFEFVGGFEYPVWITLFMTMLFIPLVLAYIEKSFKGFSENLWEYFQIISSEAMPYIPKNPIKRIFLAIWLLACTVLLAGYGGVIREFFIRTIPDDVIETWDQLFKRKDLQIITFEGSVIYNFAQTEADTNEMARDFQSRMETIYFGVDHSSVLRIFDKVLNDKYVLSMMDYFVDDCFYFMRDKKRKLCSKIYTSKEGKIISPLFLMMSRMMNDELKIRFDNLVLRLAETGLYDNWQSVSEDTRNVYKHDSMVRKHRFASEDINLMRFKGVFLLWAVGTCTSVLALIFEFFLQLLSSK